MDIGTGIAIAGIWLGAGLATVGIGFGGIDKVKTDERGITLAGPAIIAGIVTFFI